MKQYQISVTSKIRLTVFQRPSQVGLLLLLSAVSEANNGDQMIGVNAMQWGRAGAVVAKPLETGTVFVNPAGLVTIPLNEFRVDVGLGLIKPDGKVNGVKSESDQFLAPAITMAQRSSKKLVLGIGVGGLAGLGVEFQDAFPALPGDQYFKTEKKFMKIAPGLAYRINDQWSVGAALNIDRQEVTLNNPMFTLPMESGYGYGVAAGVIYKHSERFQFGVAYTSRQHMEPLEWNTAAGRYSATFDVPAFMGAGIAWNPSNSLLLEFDIKRIWFSETFDHLSLETPAGNMKLQFGWEDQMVYALGVEKQMSNKLVLRAGFNYGRSPIGSEDVDNNIGSLAIAEKHLSIGLTHDISDKLAMSASFVRTRNNELISSSGSGTRLEMQQDFLHLQVGYQY